MPPLKLPTKPSFASIPQIESRVPKPEELVVLSRPLLDATMKIGKLLKDCANKWAISGDVAEVTLGVNVPADHITILTTKEGCDEISGKLAVFQVEGPRLHDKLLEREANIDRKLYPVQIRSYVSRFNVEGSKLDVHGDLQIKVGDWEWGDALDYEPEYVYLVTVKVPVVPLRLKSELYLGLGWMDRVRKINEAVMRAHHS